MTTGRINQVNILQQTTTQTSPSTHKTTQHAASACAPTHTTHTACRPFYKSQRYHSFRNPKERHKLKRPKPHAVQNTTRGRADAAASASQHSHPHTAPHPICSTKLNRLPPTTNATHTSAQLPLHAQKAPRPTTHEAPTSASGPQMSPRKCCSRQSHQHSTRDPLRKIAAQHTRTGNYPAQPHQHTKFTRTTANAGATRTAQHKCTHQRNCILMHSIQTQSQSAARTHAHAESPQKALRTTICPLPEL